MIIEKRQLSHIATLHEPRHRTMPGREVELDENWAQLNYNNTNVEGPY